MSQPTFQPYEVSPLMISAVKQRKPGPRPNRCVWCNEIQCSHCQCAGFPKCDHKYGEPCMRPRYKRRLVCNPCEKNKLKEESTKKGATKLISRDRVSASRRKLEKGHIGIKSMSMDSALNSNDYSSNQCSFEALLRVASSEMRKVESKMSVQRSLTPERHQSNCDDIGLSMDGGGSSTANQSESDYMVSLDEAAEEVSYGSSRTTPTPNENVFIYPSRQYIPMQFFPNQSIYQQYPAPSPYASFQNYSQIKNLPSPVRGLPHLSTPFGALHAAALAAQDERNVIGMIGMNSLNGVNGGGNSM